MKMTAEKVVVKVFVFVFVFYFEPLNVYANENELCFCEEAK